MSVAKRLQYLFKDNAALPRHLQTQIRKVSAIAEANVNPPGTSEDRQSTQKSIFNEPIVLADLTREHSLPNEELIRNISRTLNYGTDDMDLDEPSPSPNDHECPNDVCNGEPHQLQVDDIVQNFWEALAVSEEIAPAPPVSGDPNDVRYKGYHSDDEIDDQVEIIYQNENHYDSDYHPPKAPHPAPPTYEQDNYATMPQYPFNSVTEPIYGYNQPMYTASHTPYQQIVSHTPTCQDNPNDRNVLVEIDQNIQDTSRSSSNSSSSSIDISDCCPKQPEEAMTVDENSNLSRTQSSLSDKCSVQNNNIKISDIASNPLNTGEDPQIENQEKDDRADKTSSGKKDLSNNYVDRILSRDWKGCLELQKQKYLERMMDEKKTAEVESRKQDCRGVVQEDIDKLNRTVITNLLMEYEVHHHGYLPTKEKLYHIRDNLVVVFIFEDKSIYIGENEEGVLKGRSPNKLRRMRNIATKWDMWKSPYTPGNKDKVPEELVQSLVYFKNETVVDTEFRNKWADCRDDILNFFKTFSIASLVCDFPFIPTKDGIEFGKSKKEVQEEQVQEGIHERTTTLKQLFITNKIPLNPYVIAYGKLDDITHCYVVLNDFKYRIEGPECLLKAVDTCDKCTSTLQKAPPKPSEYCWQFLTTQIYKKKRPRNI
ncbi:hypothetical protein QAD02_007765 [Eretmocerus hayati]|uniref:Uncharacterized protein n=1 Tax=Eretmocerus hayati TaxID=131215 RepID=A0ACC2N593_9HYME|nr:hypothetical protein QAD02_007765 [Eretmocerus hayati]